MMEEQEQTCKTCQYWIVPEHDQNPPGFRECSLCFTSDGIAESPDTLAYAMDNECYYACFVTNENFGCNQWEAIY